MQLRRGIGALALAGAVVVSLSAAGASAADPTCFGRAPTWVGSDGPDTYTGGSGTDIIVGLGGNDVLNGGGGSDFICGGAGNDTIRGSLGRDRLSGDAGADRLYGGGGDDRLLGGAGDDRLDGGPDSDSATGGLGTDTCTGAEAPASCEIFPPSGCSNPALVPAAPQTTNVTLLGSNAFQTHSILGLCFQGHCDYDYLTMVAEVRNDTGSPVRLGRATLKIYDGTGMQIATRYVYPAADALAPGQRTVLREDTPSSLCWGGETCPFPHGWASWRLVLSATFGAAGAEDDTIIDGRLASLAPGEWGGAVAEGSAVNTRHVALDWVTWWVSLYDSGGRLIDVGTSFYTGALAPGAAAPFELTLHTDEPACFSSARVGAAGS